MWFATFAWVLLPLGAAILGLLSVPLHTKVGTATLSLRQSHPWNFAIVHVFVQLARVVLRAVDAVLFFKITVGITISLYSLVVLLALITAGYEAYLLHRFHLSEQHSHAHTHMTDWAYLGRKWRLERNFWLATFTLGMWLMVYKVRGLLLYIHDLETRTPGGDAATSSAGAVRTGGETGSVSSSLRGDGGVSSAKPSAPPASPIVADTHTHTHTHTHTDSELRQRTNGSRSAATPSDAVSKTAPEVHADSKKTA